jgi:Golgi apparatus protein 1
MKRACAKELETYCSKVPHGNARAIRCLQESKGKRDFGRLCLKEVLAYEQRASSDYRLNHRLKAACARDAAALCDDAACMKDAARVCGGAVLRCLTERRDEVKADACRREVEYFERMEVADYRNDVILAAACRGDVDAFCKGVQPGALWRVGAWAGRGALRKTPTPPTTNQQTTNNNNQQQSPPKATRAACTRACARTARR